VTAALTELDITSIILRTDNQKLPVTYAIRTMPLPNGNSHFGLLQLVALDPQKQTVSIRYRLFADEYRLAPFHAAASEPNDGQPFHGVSAELSLAAPLVPASELASAVPLMLAIRNQGEFAFNLAQSQVLGELEVDGKWHKFTGPVGVRSGIFPPGRETRDIPVTLSSEWHTKDGDAELKLAPGKHTVRFAIFAKPTKWAGPGEPQPIRAVSNPVEITLTAGPDESPSKSADDVKPAVPAAIAGGPFGKVDLASADLVVVGKVDSEPIGESDKINVVWFTCDFKVSDVIRGGDFAGKTIRVSITRKTPPNGPPPALKRGEELVLLLKQVKNSPSTDWTTIGIENGSRGATPELVARLKKLAVDIAVK
jgi:hypothetical protein